MDVIEFWKMSGSGNDFILIDNRGGKIKDEEMNHLVQKVCRRRESVGADGVIFVVNSEDYDFKWRFFNADGSEAEMCGNGGRCVSRFAYLKGIAGPSTTFDTLAGPISAEVEGRIVKVVMPEPSNLCLDVGLEMKKGWVSADFINTGVPHVVICVENLTDHPVLEQGREIRYHSMFFPEGTNVDFMCAVGPDQIEIRTYERGVEDETLACGTGAIAGTLVAFERKMVSRSPVCVKTRGGETLTIHFDRKDDSFQGVWLEGNTSIVCQGRLHEEAL